MPTYHMGPYYPDPYQPVANYGYALGGAGADLITRWTPFSGPGDGPTDTPGGGDTGTRRCRGVGLAWLVLATLGGATAAALLAR